MTASEICQSALDMMAVAKAHGGRYLLPRRYVPLTERDPDTDDLYNAARWLCENGHAFWIDFPSTMAPGIELTGK